MYTLISHKWRNWGSGVCGFPKVSTQEQDPRPPGSMGPQQHLPLLTRPRVSTSGSRDCAESSPCFSLHLTCVEHLLGQVRPSAWRMARTGGPYPCPEEASGLILQIRNNPSKKSVLRTLGLKDRRKHIWWGHWAVPGIPPLGSVS